jgi:hypothetical protein
MAAQMVAKWARLRAVSTAVLKAASMAAQMVARLGVA